MNIKNTTLALTLSVLSLGVFSHHIDRIHSEHNASKTTPNIQCEPVRSLITGNPLDISDFQCQDLTYKQHHYDEHISLLIEKISTGIPIINKEFDLKLWVLDAYNNGSFKVNFREYKGEITCTTIPKTTLAESIILTDVDGITYHFSVPYGSWVMHSTILCHLDKDYMDKDLLLDGVEFF